MSDASVAYIRNASCSCCKIVNNYKKHTAKQFVALKPFSIIRFQYIHYVEYSADSGEKF